MAQPEGDTDPGQRLDPASPARGPGGNQLAATGPRRLAGRHAAGAPTLIVDSCSVRAKRGGEVVGHNLTDRGKGDQVPPRGDRRWRAGSRRGYGRQRQRHAPVRPPVPDRLRRRDLHPHRVRGQRLRRRGQPRAVPAFGAEPRLYRRGRPHGSGLGKRRRPAERSKPSCLRTSALRCATTAMAPSPHPCSRQPVSSWLQDASPGSCDHRL